MKVRMTRFVGSFVQVRDLEPGQVVDLSERDAQQFIANGMAEPVASDAADHLLEAAAMPAARRRG